MKGYIRPEDDEGNKEYKLKLINSDSVKIEHVTSQMRYRLEEGSGEAFYTLGVTDDGCLLGITDDEFKSTFSVLEQVAKKNNYSLTLISEQIINKNPTKKIYEFLVRESNKNKYIDIRVACAGNVDAGKCEAKGTKIRMYSGEIKNIEDIKKGDILAGDDGSPRNVLETTKGYGQLYKIEFTTNETITINKNHILCFKYDKSKKSQNDTIELTLEQYINLEQDYLLPYKIDYKNPNLILPLKIRNIKIAGEQEYYGFELDGNGRYVHKDGIVTHNSSLLGVLLTGEKDNGRGSARLNVFNYKHEIKSGRTSSIAQHILGFNDTREPIYYLDNLGHQKPWPEIVQQSSKIVTFFDLCGHEKYLKTTIFGLTSQFPDLVLILVGGNMGVNKMTKEHIFLCLSLHIPFAIVITKIDICKEREGVFNETIKDIKKLISSPAIRRIPYDIKTDDDIVLCSKNIHSLTTVPIFYISNVTGQGIKDLYYFFNLYSKKPKNIDSNTSKVELHVNEIFHVTGVGIVIGGQLIQGKIKVGDKLIIGPKNNSYTTIQIKSIHCKRVPVDEVDSGTYVCLGIKKHDQFTFKRGQVVLSLIDKPIQVREFEAEIIVLKSHSTTIKIGYQPVVHSCGVRQTAKIVDIKNKRCARVSSTENETMNCLRTGDRAIVTFRFCYRAEFLKNGFRILLAEGRVKIIGKIINVFEEVVKIE